MIDFQQKRKVRNVAYHRTTLIILTVVVVFAIHSTWLVYNKLRESGEQKAVLEKKTVELSENQKDLQERIDQLKTEYGVEQEIRTKFSVAKENESVVIVLDDKSANQATSTATISFWQKILNFFHLR